MTRLAQADVLRRVPPEMEQVPPTLSVGLHVPPQLIHQEINPSPTEPIEMIVARDCAEGIVVNVPIEAADF